MSGDYALIGAPSAHKSGKIDQGSINIYLRSGIGWSSLVSLDASDGEAYDYFGLMLLDGLASW